MTLRNLYVLAVAGDVLHRAREASDVVADVRRTLADLERRLDRMEAR